MQASLHSFFKNSADDSRSSNGSNKKARVSNPAENEEEVVAAASSTSSSSSTSEEEPARLRVDELSDVFHLEKTTIAPTWFNALRSEFDQPYFAEIKKFLASEKAAGKSILPPDADIYSWSRHCKLSDVKVVIVGQDPYPGEGQGHGLCFSVRPGIAIPASLRNIYKALSNDFSDFKAPSHGYLESWSRQGVLLLNAVLTLRKGEANSHKGKGWEKFTQKVIDMVNERCNNVVFLLWGKPAQAFEKKINKGKHCVITGVHPSPLAGDSFQHCGHFKKCNEYLEKNHRPPIDWKSICRADATTSLTTASVGGDPTATTATATAKKKK